MGEEERLEANAKVAAARLGSKIRRNIEWIKGNVTGQIFKLEVRKRVGVRGDMLMGTVFEQVRHCGFKIRYLSVNWGDELYRLTLAWEPDNLVDNSTDRLEEWFKRAIGAADFDLRIHDKEKGSSWKEATPLSLFNNMMGHVNKMMDPNPRVGQVHAIKVVNYALMVATKLVDEVAVEAEPKLIIDPVPLYTGSAHTPSQEFKIKPIEAEPKTPTEILEHIVETGLPPLDLGPLPNKPAEPKDASYYCPWCEHTAKLGEACRGKVCCVKCGKPINSRMGKLLKKARENHYVESKMAVNAQELARDLGTTASWAGQVMRALGWTRNADWSGRVSTWYSPPKED